MFDVARTERLRRSDSNCVQRVAHIAAVSLLLGLSCSSPGGYDEGIVWAADTVAPGHLAPDSLTSADLVPRQPRTFEISLRANTYLRISVSKGDLHLLLRVYGPAGEELIHFLDQSHSPLDTVFVSQTDGVHRFQIESMESAQRRPVEIKIGAEVVAGERERVDATAAKAFAEAETLTADGMTESLEKAIDKYQYAAQLWRGIKSSDAIKALNRCANVYSLSGKYEHARALNEQALNESRQYGDRLGMFRSLNSLAIDYSYLSDNRRAEIYLDQVLRDCDASASIEHEANVAAAHNGKGFVYYGFGNSLKSLDESRTALKLWANIGSRKGQADAHLNIAYALSNLGDQTEARRHFDQAIVLYRDIGDRRGEGRSITGTGVIESLEGNEQASLTAHLKARELFRLIGDQQGEAITFNAAGQAYEDLKDQQTALDNYQKALQLFVANGSFDSAASSEYKIARIFRVAGDFQTALDHYHRMISFCRAGRKERMEAYALKDIAEIYQKQGKVDQALALYRRVLNTYRRVRDLRGEAMTLNSIGDLLFEHGAKRQAFSSYKAALPLIKAAGDRDGTINTLYSIGFAARDLGLYDEALQAVGQSIDQIETLRNYLISPERRTSYFSAVQQHYALYVNLLMELQRRDPGSAYATTAFGASESEKARTLVESIAESGANIRDGLDPDLVEKDRALTRELIANERVQMQLAPNSETRAEAAEIERHVREIVACQQVLQAETRAKNPRYAALTLPQPVKLEEVQAGLQDEDTMLLEYFLGEPKSYLWAVTKNSVESYELPPRATIDVQVREVYNSLTARQDTADEATYQSRVERTDAQYEAAAATLSETLLGQVAARIGQRRLLIVADGVLQYIPFEALPAPAPPRDGKISAANGNAASTLLLTEHEVITLPSFSALMALRRWRRPAPPGDKILAMFADPVFAERQNLFASANSRPATEDQLAVALRGMKGFEEEKPIKRLPYSLKEAAGIEELLNSKQYVSATGAAANRSAVLSPEISECQIVHFATHGFIHSEYPILSGLLLSGESRTGNNGFIGMDDIYNLRLSARLVVLSACNSALGKEVKGEGVFGLSRGFMYAGASSVVASLWKVDDHATAELMKRFYAAMLRDHLPPAAALRVAKISIRQEKRWSFPYYWAAFVIQGEYRDPIEVKMTSESHPYLIAGLLLGLLVITSSAYLIGKQRNRRMNSVPLLRRP
jgi:CHAT domain-containing protein/predicted negative regulator of RcsB-dependent stress response